MIRKKHVWGSPACVRNKRHRNFNGEVHPCFWCGQPMPLDDKIEVCTECSGVFCPSCGKCMCNITDEEFEALRQLRRRYCCNSWHFNRGIEMTLEDYKNLQLVPHFKTALEYCRRQEGKW